jgi:DNA-directed RNA polymerase specialized sigma24 family protein
MAKAFDRVGFAGRREVESRDILQQTLLKAFQHIEQFEGENRDTLMGWLATIAWNEIRDQADHYRRLRRDACPHPRDARLAAGPPAGG